MIVALPLDAHTKLLCRKSVQCMQWRFRNDIQTSQAVGAIRFAALSIERVLSFHVISTVVVVCLLGRA